MPIYNWMKILETGDLKHIFKSGKGRVTERTLLVWHRLQDQHIEEFGLTESYKKELRLKKRIIDLNVQFIETKEKHLLNIVKVTEGEISLLNHGESIKFYELLDHVEKYKGFAIDPKKTSVLKWYYTLKNMSKHGETD